MSQTTRRTKSTLTETSVQQMDPNVELEVIEQPNTADEPFTALRDITHRFLMSDALNPSTPIPTQRRRRPKIPSTIARLRLARERPSTHAKASRPMAVASSLPPSSPPSTSSREVPIIAEACGHSVAPSVTAVELQHQQARDKLSPNSPDPFGFLAAERKLKAARMRRVNLDTYGFEDDGDWQALGSEDDDLYFDEGDVSIHIFPTPMPRTNLGKLGMGNATKQRDASTPHGRPQKRRPKVSVGASTPNTSSLPSTPSPSKPSRMPQSLTDVESPEPETRRRGITLASTRKTTGGKKKQRMDGRSAVRNLEALLPKRPRRGKAVVEDSRNEERRRPEKARKDKINGKGKVITDAKTVSKGGAKEEEPDNEKWAREREARIEYFRKLADYSFEKENVYIV